jgi:hypothetical protein
MSDPYGGQCRLPTPRGIYLRGLRRAANVGSPWVGVPYLGKETKGMARAASPSGAQKARTKAFRAGGHASSF